jgi:glucose dehydrogenase
LAIRPRRRQSPARRPPTRREFLGGVGAAFTTALLASGTAAAATPKDTEWRYYGNDSGSNKYAPLDQINRRNVNQLHIAWRRPAVDAAFANPTFSNSYETTPLLVNGVMYVSNGMGFVEAFAPDTGKTVWVQEPPGGGRENLTGHAPRGVAYWSSGSMARIFIFREQSLVAVDAHTGKLASDFGDHGQINMEGKGPGYPEYFLSPPVVCRDVVIIGSASSDNASVRAQNPGDVYAFDVETGELRWTFHVIPRPGEFGYDTWEGDSASYTGAANIWAPFSADQELGYVYLPGSTPTDDWYGGNRLGNGLFGECLTCVEASTGKRVWSFQTVHHGLWDYDLPAAPILPPGEFVMNGKRVKAVIQVTKTGFVFAFNRVNGEPIWPIEERPVPPSTAPGEHASPTQPFPTKPAPFERQGVSLDDLIDFTPEIHDEALRLAKQYVLGPLFTPPSVVVEGGTQGTAVLPGWAGGANWGGAPFDPDTGVLYVPSVTDPHVEGLAPPKKGDEPYVRQKLTSIPGPMGLPFVKPPYGRITAINMKTGDHVWMAANGDGPRDHPALKALNLPPLGSSGRVGAVLTKELLFIGDGDPIVVATPPLGGGKKFRALDKSDGKTLWETEFPAGQTGTPMTYMYKGKQYVVVAIGSRDHTAELVALSL